MQDQKNTPLKEPYEATDPQHETRNLEDAGGDEGAASPNIRNRYVAYGLEPTTVGRTDRPSEPSPNSDISISSEAPTDTDETHHVTSTMLLTVTEALTLVVVDHTAWYELTATLDGGSEVPTSSSEVPTFSSEILSLIHMIPLINTPTILIPYHFSKPGPHRTPAKASQLYQLQQLQRPRLRSHSLPSLPLNGLAS